MSGTSIQVTVDDDVVQRAIAGIYRRSLSLREPFEAIGASLVTSTKHRFETERAPDGQAWHDLSEPRQAERQRAGREPNANKLRFTNRLYDSITYGADDVQLSLGTNVVYAALHQLGGTDEMAPGPAAVDARPFLGVDRDDEGEIAATLLEFLGEGA